MRESIRDHTTQLQEKTNVDCSRSLKEAKVDRSSHEAAPDDARERLLAQRPAFCGLGFAI